MNRGRILFIDAYDSFSNSIIALLHSELAVSVECIKIDDPRFLFNIEAFFHFLGEFDAVVAGPGPGHPKNSNDVGLIKCLWALPDEHLLPVLGICLGFQSLCLAFGGQVTTLREPRHGLTANVTHCRRDIFTGTDKIVATQYHSLYVQLEHEKGRKDLLEALWNPSDDSKELIPLAWDLSDASNGPTLMAARHCYKPFWGVQYHPESICTNHEGRNLIKAWWKEANIWPLKRSSKLSLYRSNDAPSLQHMSEFENISARRCKSDFVNSSLPSIQVHFKKIDIGQGFDIADFIKALQNNDAETRPLLLESGTRKGEPINSETGRFSIVGLSYPGSLQIRYFTNGRRLEVEDDRELVLNKQTNIAGGFHYIDEVMHSHRASLGPSQSPFWGGLIGYISYEAGLENIDVPPPPVEPDRPDLWFQMIERSVIVDHMENVVYFQSLRREDDDWIQSMERVVQTTFNKYSESKVGPSKLPPNAKITHEPEQEHYHRKIHTCQSHLRAGSSYELCLTDQTRVESATDAWSLYRRLRSGNPAPFSSYLTLKAPDGPGISIVSSSPERFLSWTREKKCQFRPIKGTVKKTPNMTRAKAEELLSSVKERAENLMIVDLIRHDLYGVKGYVSIYSRIIPKT